MTIRSHTAAQKGKAMSAIDKRTAIMLWGVAIVVIVGGVFLAVRLWSLDWPVLMAILLVFGIMVIIAAVGWWRNRHSKAERITRNILKRLEGAAASRRARGRSADGGGGGVVLMTSDLDIYRSAAVLVREHGEDAALEATQRADAMLEKGDLEGHAVWKRIGEAVEELQQKERREGEAAH